jgi:hypothetical protein
MLSKPLKYSTGRDRLARHVTLRKEKLRYLHRRRTTAKRRGSHPAEHLKIPLWHLESISINAAELFAERLLSSEEVLTYCKGVVTW